MSRRTASHFRGVCSSRVESCCSVPGFHPCLAAATPNPPPPPIHLPGRAIFMCCAEHEGESYLAVTVEGIQSPVQYFLGLQTQQLQVGFSFCQMAGAHSFLA